jgi:two-component system nitrate/nitrite response regulator NarL
MPVLDGIGVLESMRNVGDYRCVVVLVTDIGDDELGRLVRADASAILYKQGSKDRLFKAIDIVRIGGRYFDESLVQRLRALLSQSSAQGSVDRLSQREYLMVLQVAEESSNRRIASDLGIMNGTVKVTLHKIFGKLNVKNRTELALW